MAEQERIACTIDVYRWRKPDADWATGRAIPEDGGKSFAFSGACTLDEGTPVELVGRWTEHPQYGRQFEVSTVGVIRTFSNEAVARLLARGVPGVGPVAASKLVEASATQSTEKGALVAHLTGNPVWLADASGVSLELVEACATYWTESTAANEVKLALAEYGFTELEISAIEKRYGGAAVTTIQRNPYTLVRCKPSMHFGRIDGIAIEKGMGLQDPRRIRCGVVEVFHRATKEGHTCVDAKAFVEGAYAVLGFSQLDAPKDLILGELEALEALGIVVARKLGTVSVRGLARYAEAEEALMGMVVDSLEALSKVEGAVQIEDLGLSGDVCASLLGFPPTDEQTNAVAMVRVAPFSFVTGGGGVGKTTVVKLIGELADRMGKTVIFGAPTGKAAKRMAEATGRDARTIHSLLQIQPEDGQDIQLNGHDVEYVSQVRGGTDAFDGSIVVLDEMSMLDSSLAGRLVGALRSAFRVVFVFDSAQLPPVGAGCPTLDLYACGMVPTVTLTKTHRNTGDLQRAILGVRQGVLARSPKTRDDSGEWLPYVTVNADAQTSYLGARQFFEELALDDPRSCQAIAPIKKGASGVHALNHLAQSLRIQRAGFCPVEWSDEGKPAAPMVGDKIVCTRNVYEKKEGRRSMLIANGSTGILVSEKLSAKGKAVEMVVETEDGQEITLKDKDVWAIELGWCLTVHKSQGSEWANVLYVHPQGGHKAFLDRRMVYTAMSRPTRRLIVVGNLRFLGDCAATARGVNRRTFITPASLHALYTEQIQEGNAEALAEVMHSMLRIDDGDTLRVAEEAPAAPTETVNLGSVFEGHETPWG